MLQLNIVHVNHVTVLSANVCNLSSLDLYFCLLIDYFSLRFLLSLLHRMMKLSKARVWCYHGGQIRSSGRKQLRNAIMYSVIFYDYLKFVYWRLQCVR